MVNTYSKYKGHKFLTNLTNSEHLAFLYSDHTKKSTANKTDKEGTTQEDVDAGNAKKQWKFDAAIESLVSIAI